MLKARSIISVIFICPSVAFSSLCIQIGTEHLGLSLSRDNKILHFIPRTEGSIKIILSALS